MSSYYITKNKGNKYTRDELKQAVAKVKLEVSNPYRDSKHYNIPLTTIINHVKERCKNKSK